MTECEKSAVRRVGPSDGWSATPGIIGAALAAAV